MKEWMGKYMLKLVVIMEGYQIVNKENPNSKDNTVVFSLFEAKDLRTNLRTGLERFKSQIDQLQLMEWR